MEEGKFENGRDYKIKTKNSNIVFIVIAIVITALMSCVTGYFVNIKKHQQITQLEKELKMKELLIADIEELKRDDYGDLVKAENIVDTKVDDHLKRDFELFSDGMLDMFYGLFEAYFKYGEKRLTKDGALDIIDSMDNGYGNLVTGGKSVITYLKSDKVTIYDVIYIRSNFNNELTKLNDKVQSYIENISE